MWNLLLWIYFLFTQWKNDIMWKDQNASVIICTLFLLNFLWFSLRLYMQTSRMRHLNDTLLFSCGQLWNPRMPFSVDVSFPLQQYNPTLSADGHACLLPLVASHFHFNTWTLSWCTILHLLRICFVKSNFQITWLAVHLAS